MDSSRAAENSNSHPLPCIFGAFTSFPKKPFKSTHHSVHYLDRSWNTNFVNDYYDFIKGADTHERKGPLRVVQSGLVKPEAMKKAVYVLLTVTSLSSLFLIAQGGLWIAVLIVLALLLAFAYTTGPYPLAYKGLGDLFVFICFGPLATAGTFYLQTYYITLESFLIGLGPGLLSTAVLTVNNLRDIHEDRKAKKMTLCVRFGRKFGRWEYSVMIGLSALLPLLWNRFLPLLILFPAYPLVRSVWKLNGKDLNPLLGKTALLLWIFTLLYGIECMSALS
jgi:1,4-dihydroxy-2-naphthoate octaprenyltransferase